MLGKSSIVDLPKYTDARGTLVVAEHVAAVADGRHPTTWRISDIKFPIRRVYVIRHESRRPLRGGHAHKRCRQVLIHMKGVVSLRLDSFRELNYIPWLEQFQAVDVHSGTWVEVSMSYGAMMMVICSEPYEEREYIRDRGEFDQMQRDLRMTTA